MKALIFDLDGTLWDSSKPVAECWQTVGQKLLGPTFHLSQAEARAQMGKTMDEIAASFAPKGYSEAGIAKLGEAFFQAENAYLAQHPGVLFPGVKETLSELKNHYDLYIVSNCQSGYIETFLPLLPSDTFKGHMCFDDTKKAKCFTIKALMDRYGIKEALYIGDTARDEEASSGAGIGFIHAAYGFGAAKNPRGKLSQFAELPNLLLSLGF